MTEAGGAGAGAEAGSPSPPANPVDLHSHTTESDGTLAPAELVRYAAARGLRALGVTDHDTVGGLLAAAAEGARVGVEVIPGVELGSDVTGAEVHVLGYFVDPADAPFVARLSALAERRRERVARIVERLAALGYPVDLARVLELAGPGTVGRPHVARALVERGRAADVADAFDRFLAVGRPAYVPRHPFSPEDAVGLILSAGGVPVLAHPFSTGDPEATVDRLVPAGLRGLEVDYGEYDEARRAELRALAERRGLIATGGSDFHGPGHRPGRDLGGPPVRPEVVEQLRVAAGRRRSPSPAG